ncbi:hypothetical protein [Vibrio scophthalmi]|uniref:Phage tail collar domain-containing protein n=1 Tax=Vibrio scophthalmi TaxID=45658 RepID=A0A1E3WK63_9VIBR|nr:hypothetical protein [Vibrio scophthalmi]ODS10163.1 hypothetical protein VSF3289_00418 [Vibrio scophthalmi]
MLLVVINPQKSGGGGYESGHIRIHNGTIADIPEGWVLCDGANGTPPMVDRAVVGAGAQYQPAQCFGADNQMTQGHTLSIDEMPSHNHREASLNFLEPGGSGTSQAKVKSQYSFQYTQHSGGNEPHDHGNVDVRQKSIALIWIMKL